MSEQSKGDRHSMETRQILNAETLKKYLEQEGSIEWVRLETLLAETPESCVDGRGDKGIIGVPGGNAGEFVLALSTYEDLTGAKLGDDQIEKIFEEYLKRYGKFYFHSDTHALAHMGVDENELRNPAPEKREKILEELTDPKNIGCGHLKSVANDTKGYGVRREIINGMIRAFFKNFWNGNENLNFTVLSGDHKEGAVVIVKVDAKDEDVNGDTEIPTVQPAVGEGGAQAFIYHPQAVKFLRKEIAKSINEVIVGGKEVDTEEFAKKMMENGDHQLELTVTTLAKDEGGRPLPQFITTFSKEGAINVEEVN